MNTSTLDIHPAPIAVKASVFDAVWNFMTSAPRTPGQIAALFAILAHTERSGIAFPSLARIGRLAGLKTKRTTIKAIEELERSGHLAVERHMGRPNTYRARPMPPKVKDAIVEEVQKLWASREQSATPVAASDTGSPEPVAASDTGQPVAASDTGSPEPVAVAATGATESGITSCHPNHTYIHSLTHSGQTEFELPGLNGMTSQLAHELATRIDPLLVPIPTAIQILKSIPPVVPPSAVLQGHRDYMEAHPTGKFSHRLYRRFIEQSAKNIAQLEAQLQVVSKQSAVEAERARKRQQKIASGYGCKQW